MDSRTEMPEYGGEASPGSQSEYLRALKQSNEKPGHSSSCASPYSNAGSWKQPGTVFQYGKTTVPAV